MLTTYEQKEIESILNAPSLFPNRKRKSKSVRYSELLSWKEKYNEINIFYNDYGFDIENHIANQDDFLDNGIFKEQRFQINSKFTPLGSKFPYNYTNVFRDKRIFDAYFRQIIPCGIVKTHAYIVNDKIFVTNGISKIISINEFSSMYSGKTLAFKRTFGQNGSDLKKVTVINDSTVIVNDTKKSISDFFNEICAFRAAWVIQDWVNQHPFYSSLNNSSINTMRIVSFNTGSRIVFSNASLIVGMPNRIINNVPHHLKDYSINTNGTFGSKILNMESYSIEDNTQSNEPLPFYNHAKEMIEFCHYSIPEIFTIGWDIAFTPDGPLILEGNDGWHPANIQRSACIGARKLWNNSLEERKNNMI